MRALAGLVHELACNVGVTDSGVSPRSLRVRLESWLTLIWARLVKAALA